MCSRYKVLVFPVPSASNPRPLTAHVSDKLPCARPVHLHNLRCLLLLLRELPWAKPAERRPAEPEHPSAETTCERSRHKAGGDDHSRHGDQDSAVVPAGLLQNSRRVVQGGRLLSPEDSDV